MRNGWRRNQAEDELPDTVVRMYRESLDDDGLDLLRRGPRNAAERLAYAQGVDPEAYRKAQPAAASAQAGFAQRGLLDGRQHFVGPDRNLYLRDEITTEPLHASIRRGFETAVPGFRRASFDEALAELQTPSGGGGSGRLTGDADEDELTTTEAVPAGWQTAYPGGPLRMREIASEPISDPG